MLTNANIAPDKILAPNLAKLNIQGGDPNQHMLKNVEAAAHFRAH